MLKNLHDYRIYLLIIPAALALFWIDSVVAQTWLQLGLALPVLLGVALLMRKALFHVDVSAAADIAMHAPTGAALVVLADRLFMAAVVIGGVLWLRG
ncbi:hypothetical protein CXB49_10745 [Chromobacterium sp. ATCC 53434]|uniref:hypothetical protein n=1 Tax=Chromobacterium sp. (strain ATCC 53434 / SC 14030) TaxID=2059672 RepID=UPI000C757938|nr:hypothetical protein [Chromobacterium sp. ATCC 53434]AUH51253.1 hypothetical protein CXB49_10745 [Chromobacterium sp. ATCC 53434]